MGWTFGGWWQHQSMEYYITKVPDGIPNNQQPSNKAMAALPKHRTGNENLYEHPYL